MIDHILTFADEDAAKASKALSQFYFADRLDPDWNRSITFPGISPLTAGGKLSGWWIMVSLDTLDKDLASQPECVLVMDRDADSAGLASIKDDADAGLKLDGATLESIVNLSGKPAGSRYESDSFAVDKIAAAVTLGKI